MIGTSGLSDADLAVGRAQFEGSGANAIVAANFAIGAVLSAPLPTRRARTWTASR